MQVQQILSTTSVRPPRLNLAGWCIWCGERDCSHAQCIRNHSLSLWGPCTECGGTQRIQGQMEFCGWCVVGLVQYDSEEAAAQAWQRMPLRVVSENAGGEIDNWIVHEPVYVVTDKARREAARYARIHGADTAELAEAAGLVPRIDTSAYAWDYAAGCPKSVTGIDRTGC